MKQTFRVFHYLRRYPWLAAGTMLTAIVGTLLVAVFPDVTRRIVQDVIQGDSPELLWPLVGIALGAFLLQGILNAVRIILNNTFEQLVIYDLRSDLYEHIQRLPLHWFDDRATGDIMTRLVEDVTSVERVLIDGIEQGTTSILQIIVVTGFMLTYSPTLTLAAAAPIPFLIAGALLYTLTARPRYRKQRTAASAMNSVLHDNLAGIRQIKTFTSEPEEHARFNGTSRKLADATLTVMRAWAAYNPSMTFFTACGPVIVIGVAAAQVLAGNLELATLVAFLVFTPFLYEPIGRLHQLNQIFQSGRAASERVFEIIDSPAEPDGAVVGGSESPSAPSFTGDVRYEQVAFGYGSGDDTAGTLHDINFHARPGEMIALVGPTGAGKTSLVSLLVRFYEIDSGKILVDGQPIDQIPKRTLRQSRRHGHAGELPLQRDHGGESPHRQARRDRKRKCGKPSPPPTPPTSSAACPTGSTTPWASAASSSASERSSASPLPARC